MTIRLLGISGSLRRDSFNTAILRTLADEMPEGVELRIAPLNDIPLYDGDADTDTPPPPVAALRAAIGAADGLILASPEYNHGISGVLKNALDWASRPYGAATITGKPVLTLTSSMMSTGGARAQAQLNDVVTSLAARLVLRPQIVVGAAHEKIVEGRLADSATLDFIKGGVRDLLADIAR
jgi:chromate reductase, NAD(P)H dehydrogenase (quinone)